MAETQKEVKVDLPKVEEAPVERECKFCKKTLPLVDFTKSKNAKWGYLYKCKPCAREYTRKKQVEAWEKTIPDDYVQECKKCHQKLPATEFFRVPSKTGLGYSCKKCYTEQTKSLGKSRPRRKRMPSPPQSSPSGSSTPTKPVIEKTEDLKKLIKEALAEQLENFIKEHYAS